MTETKVTLTDTLALIPLEQYVNHMRAVCMVEQILQNYESDADDEFRAGIFLHSALYVCRSFPKP